MCRLTKKAMFFLLRVRFLIDKDSFARMDQRIQNSLFIFACTNSVMDPIVYGFFNLRKAKRPKEEPRIQLKVTHSTTKTARSFFIVLR